MTLVRTALVLLAAAILIQPASAANFTLSGDNTKVEFTGTKKDGAHTGNFPKLSGAAKAASTDPASLELNVVIDVAAMKSDADKLTAHLKSPDFFEVKRYPEAKFVSTSVKKGKNGYTVEGNLTMRGETKKLSFPATIEVAGDSLKLNAEFKLNRSDWGMTYGKGMIDDAVAMKVNVDAAAK